MINVQIAYILPEKATIIDCQVDDNSDVLCAIITSDILSLCQISLDMHKVGIYGKLVALTDRLKEDDRIEIYRPLINDPKSIRRKRANAKSK